MDFSQLKYRFIPAQTSATHTLLVLHGTGGDENDLIPLAKNFGNQLNILSVRGNVLENGMPRFFRRLQMGVFDEDDLTFRTQELIYNLKKIALAEKFDETHIIALGYSNGANIAGSLLALYPDFLRGAILFRPMKPFQHLEVHPVVNQTKIFVSSGKYDPLYTSENSSAYAEFLKEAGYAVEFHLLETGHNLTNEDLSLAVQWYTKNFFMPTK